MEGKASWYVGADANEGLGVVDTIASSSAVHPLSP